GLDYTERQADRLESVLRPLLETGEATALYTTVGRFDPNNAHVLAQLAPWGERRTQQEIQAEIEPLLAGMPGVTVRISSPNSLGLRDSGGIEVALLGTDYTRIHEAAQALAFAMETEI